LRRRASRRIAARRCIGATSVQSDVQVDVLRQLSAEWESGTAPNLRVHSDGHSWVEEVLKRHSTWGGRGGGEGGRLRGPSRPRRVGGSLRVPVGGTLRATQGRGTLGVLKGYLRGTRGVLEGRLRRRARAPVGGVHLVAERFAATTGRDAHARRLHKQGAQTMPAYAHTRTSTTHAFAHRHRHRHTPTSTHTRTHTHTHTHTNTHTHTHL
jgi:hypothetical protein